MSEAFLELGSRTPALSQGNKPKPKLLTLGGDHSVALPALRALNKVHGGPVAVLHFDSHLDTWNPAKYTSSAWESAQSHFNHGSMFWIASNEGLILNGSSAHAGLRTRLTGNSWKDYDDDDRQGFLRISSDDIDDMGTKGIIDAIIERIGVETPTYLSIDIDVIDPGLVSKSCVCCFDFTKRGLTVDSALGLGLPSLEDGRAESSSGSSGGWRISTSLELIL